MCGIFAANIGAKSVLITDGEVLSLQWVAENVRCSGLCVECHPSHESHIQIEQLIWGDLTAINAVLERYGQFDIIIGADVAFHPIQVEPFFVTISHLMDVNGFGIFTIHPRFN